MNIEIKQADKYSRKQYKWPGKNAMHPVAATGCPIGKAQHQDEQEPPPGYMGYYINKALIHYRKGR